MADAIAIELHMSTSNDVLRILNHYWQDKIAHVWQVDDMLEAARSAGKPDHNGRCGRSRLAQDLFE